jgi:predicted transcriptional regulator
VNADQLGEVLSSRVRLKIADAISQRPRTLGELSYITGISVQGVLRHLRRLEKVGLLEERRVTASAPKARRVYAAKAAILEDYSSGDLTIAKLVEKWPEAKHTLKQGTDLESMAAEVLILRRRVREEAKRIGRMIDEAAAGQEVLESALKRMHLSEEERLILEVILTEETVEDGVRALSRFYGMEARRSIDEALAKARRNVDK